MALFGKKAKKDGGVEDAPKKKQKVDKNKVASVIEESVPENIVDAIITQQNNGELTFQVDGKTQYLGLCLNVDDIGGLSKKSKKSEEKGNIINLINHGDLLTLARQEEMDENKIILIPTKNTLEYVAEYSLLQKPLYKCTWIDESGVPTITDVDIKITGVYELLQEDEDGSALKEALAQKGIVFDSEGTQGEVAEESEEMTEEVTEESGTQESTMDASMMDEQPVMEEQPLYDEQPDDMMMGDPMDEMMMGDSMDEVALENMPSRADEEIPAYDDNPDAIEGDVDEVQFGADQVSEPEVVDTGLVEDVQQDQVQEETPVETQQEVYEETKVIDGDHAQEALERFILRDGMDLAVNMASFEDMIKQNAKEIIVSAPLGNGQWLNEYVKERVQEANTAIALYHNMEVDRLRQRYIELMNANIRLIENDTKLDKDANTPFSQLSQEIDRQRDESQARIDMDVQLKQQALQEEFDKKLEDELRRATDKVRADHYQRWGDVYEQKKARVPSQIKNDIERKWSMDHCQLNEYRKKSIGSRYDSADEFTIDKLRVEYGEVIKQEYKMYEDAMKDIKEYIEQNLATDTSNIRNEERRLDNENEIAKEKEAHAKELEILRADLESKKADLVADLEKEKLEFAKALQAKQEEFDRQQAFLQKEIGSLELDKDKLISRNDELAEEKRSEYEHQVSILQDTIKSKDVALEQLGIQHKQQNRTTGFLMAVATIAALAVGSIGGTVWYANTIEDRIQVQETQDTQELENTVDALNKKVDALQKKNKVLQDQVESYESEADVNVYQ